MAHLEVRQERDLNTIREHMIEQADRVAKAVEQAVDAVQTGNRKVAWQIVLDDNPINRYMRQIDRLCHSFIAVHLPSAGPLRLLSSIIRANTELERIGDYAVTIAREAVQLSGPPQGSLGRELERVSGETLLMLRQSVKAFRDLNAELARGTMSIADQLEHNMDMVYEELISNTERDQVKDNLAVFVVFNQLKRVADQAKNLCEHTIFAQTGEQKAPRKFNILFLDKDNSTLGPLAAAIAGSSYPNSGRYATASKSPAVGLSTALTGFLEARGMSVADRGPRALADISVHQLSEYQLIVCLEGQIEEYIGHVPFHTAVLEWQQKSNEDMDALYRELAPGIRDLMEQLRGEGAD
jgi:phosphate transport system protein